MLPSTRAAPAGWSPRTKFVSSLLIVIWTSCNLGRTGPTKRRLVGRLCPNRSISPGPDRLKVGAVAPTVMTCPATLTVCSGVTRSATAIEAAATISSTAGQATHRGTRRALAAASSTASRATH
jgi:hypothetical protein